MPLQLLEFTFGIHLTPDGVEVGQEPIGDDVIHGADKVRKAELEPGDCLPRQVLGDERKHVGVCRGATSGQASVVTGATGVDSARSDASFWASGK